MIAENKRYGCHIEDSRLQQAFKNIAGSTKRYINPDSDEAEAILKEFHQNRQRSPEITCPYIQET
jgi:hypothetical protein